MSNTDPNIVIMLVSNKSELYDIREVKTAMGEDYAKNKQVIFIETSTAYATKINKAFETMIKSIFKVYAEMYLLLKAIEDKSAPILPTSDGEESKTVQKNINVKVKPKSEKVVILKTEAKKTPKTQTTYC
jgi:GTPase SAR1 family protein